jgi:hypothetical protein
MKLTAPINFSSHFVSATDNVVIGKTGDIYNAQTGERLGSLTDKSLGGTKRWAGG